MDQQGEILDARNKNKLSGKAVIWILLAVIVLLLAAVGALAYQQIKNRFEKPQKESASPTATVASTATPKTIDAGVTWITPVALSDLGFFAKNQNFDGMGELSSVNYYKVGATADGNDIIDAVITYAPTSYDVFRIIKKSDGYYKVTKNSRNAFGNTDAIVESGLKIDGTTEFKSLNPDKKMIKGQMKLTFSFNGGIEKESGYSNGSKIDDTNTRPIYSETGEEISGSDGALEMERYYLKLNDSTRAYYEPNPTFLRDDGTLDISWSDSSKSGLSYQKVATGGCGGGAGTFPAVAKADLLSGKEQVASDAKMYFVSDKDNPLDRFIYDIYKNSVGSPRSNDDFIANIGMLVWTDGYGANIVYSNRDFSFEGECGKPVVYL